MPITITKGYAPPSEDAMQYAGYGFYGQKPSPCPCGRPGCRGCPTCPGCEFNGLRDYARPLAGYAAVADNAPSRLTWFALGIATVIAWPAISTLIGVGQAGGLRLKRRVERE